MDIAWLSGGLYVAASCADGRVRIVDPDTVEVIDDFPGIDGWAYALAAHPTDGSIVVGGSDGQIRRLLLELKAPE